MKKLLFIFIFFASLFSAAAQPVNSWGGQYGYLNFPRYNHLSQLPATATPMTVAVVIDSVGSTTVLAGIYFIDSLGRHPLLVGGGGGGGGGSVAIGTSVGSSTPGSIFFADGSSTLAQSSSLYWDYTNLAMGVGNNAPHADLDIFHNESSSQFAGLMLERFYTGSSQPIIHFASGRGTRSSPLEPNAGDSAGAFFFEKWNGSANQPIAKMQVMTVGTPSTTNIRASVNWFTDSSGTPSQLKWAAGFDDQQTTNVKHLFVGPASISSPGYSVDGNSIYANAEILGTQQNLAYGDGLVLADNSGVAKNNGLGVMFDVETGVGVYVGAGIIRGYKANATNGDYGGGIRFLARKYGSVQAEVFRITDAGNFLLGDTTDSGEKLKVSGLSNDTTGSIGPIIHVPDSGFRKTTWAKAAAEMGITQGGYAYGVNVQGDNSYTVVSTDEVIIFNTALTASRTITLPNPVAKRHIKLAMMTNIFSGNQWNITTVSGTATIYMAGTSGTNLATNTYSVIDFYSDGTSWYGTQVSLP